MADDLQGKPLSEFSTASIVGDDTLFFASKPNALTNTGYDTVGVPGSTLKNLLNEELYADLIATLAIGETSVTFSDARITSTSTIEFFTDTFGVNPTAVTVSTGSVTATFDAQESAVSVKLRLWLSDRGANYNSPIKSFTYTGDGTDNNVIFTVPDDCFFILAIVGGGYIAAPFLWGATRFYYASGKNGDNLLHDISYDASGKGIYIKGYANSAYQVFNGNEVTYTVYYLPMPS